jgi:tetratricopeptide (TPR) repeat protein
MKIDFHSPARKWLTAVILLACAVVYLGLSAREFVAAWLGSRPEISSLQRAAWLDPGNAEYRNHVGRYYDLVARDPVAAIGQYKTAVQLNPHSARYWFDLASAYQVLGDTTNQASALERAIQADSMTPDVAWEAGNLYLVKGDTEKALHEFSVVLANDTSLASTAIQYCWRIDPDVDSLLRDVVPPNVDAYLAFMTLLETKQETAGAIKVWDALVKTRQPFEQRRSNDFFQYLIMHKEVDAATRVWQETADRFGLTAFLPSPNNLIVNGSFSLDTINAGLDWQHQKQASVQLTLDPSDYHSGPRSLLINFDGPGIHDAGIYQLVPVQPNTTYEFSAYYKNGEMDGAGGPHFTIQDMYSQAIYYESDELKDAGYWKSVTGVFTTPVDAKLLVVHIRRVPEGSPIRGKVWVDDLRLTRKN